MTVQEAGSAAAAGGTPPASAMAWYVGRDGQQYGPVGDHAFWQMLGSGQILPTDLVWRDGFAEWQPASSVRPATQPVITQPVLTQPVAQSHAARPAASTADASREQPREPVRTTRSEHAVAASQGSSVGRERPDRASSTAAETDRRKRKTSAAEGESALRRRTRTFGRGLAWTAILVFFTLTLGAAYLVLTSDKNLMRMATAVIPQFGALFGDRIPSTAPIGGFATTTQATDVALQRSSLWQVLKKYHPAWYGERVKEATDGMLAGKPEIEILTGLMQGVVKLRRQYAGDAASAPITRLKSIASLFATNLVRLKGHSVEACFQYVSTGESAPAVVALLQNPEYSSALQAQIAATFEGIDEGRTTPRVYPQPKASDYDVLVTALEARGWKKEDLTLFADSQKLSQAAPETVCRLVTEWFEAQIAIKEPDIQLRLIADSLRPVVSG